MAERTERSKWPRKLVVDRLQMPQGGLVNPIVAIARGKRTRRIQDRSSRIGFNSAIPSEGHIYRYVPFMRASRSAMP